MEDTFSVTNAGKRASAEDYSMERFLLCELKELVDPSTPIAESLSGPPLNERNAWEDRVLKGRRRSP